MNKFSFAGELPASKSLMNRSLIVKSYFNNFSIYGDSQCDDVVLMKNALELFKLGKTEFCCGSAGTVLRFLALRVAREKEEFLLTGSKELMTRLPDDLVQVLSQLGARVKLTSEGFRIKGYDWKVMGDALHLQSKLSSQFATGVFVNAWKYPLDLFITVPESMASMSYFKMTLKMLDKIGMKIHSNKNEYHIPKNQILVNDSFVCEPDVSSSFAIVSAAILSGDIKIDNFVKKSIQPDIYFLEILEQMGVKYQFEKESLLVSKSHKINPIDVNLKNCPDLFPVLSVLCSFAEGESLLFGAPHLASKESHRIDTTYELLQKAGVTCEKRSDGIKITGNPLLQPSSFEYNSRKDHRLAMAAGLFMLKGFEVNLTSKIDVNKSFPSFWDIIGK